MNLVLLIHYKGKEEKICLQPVIESSMSDYLLSYTYFMNEQGMSRFSLPTFLYLNTQNYAQPTQGRKVHRD